MYKSKCVTDKKLFSEKIHSLMHMCNEGNENMYHIIRCTGIELFRVSGLKVINGGRGNNNIQFIQQRHGIHKSSAALVECPTRIYVGSKLTTAAK